MKLAKFLKLLKRKQKKKKIKSLQELLDTDPEFKALWLREFNAQMDQEMREVVAAMRNSQ